jgi:ribosome-binding factor A
MSSIRAEKVGSVIKRVLATAVSGLANRFNAGLVTITSVRLSSDLQVAKVYLSVYGGKMPPVKFLDILEENKGSLRSEVGSQVRLRHTPDLRFFLDDTLDQMEHIQNLLNSVKKKPGDDDSK